MGRDGMLRGLSVKFGHSVLVGVECHVHDIAHWRIGSR